LNKGVKQAVHFDILIEETTINVPGDFPTIQAALDSLKRTFIPSDVTVTIKVAAGTYTQTERILANHPNGKQIRIEGADPIPYAVTGFGGVTATTFGINLASVAGLAVGDVVFIPSIEGVGTVMPVTGAYRIAGIEGNTVTVSHKFRMPVSELSVTSLSPNTQLLKMATVIHCLGCHGFQVANDTVFGELKNVAFVGDGSTGGDIGTYRGILMWQGTKLYLRKYVACINFSGSGLTVSGNGAFCFATYGLFCNNGTNGIEVGEGAAIFSNDRSLICNHNALYGILAEGLAPGCYVWHAVACGNGKCGVVLRGCSGNFDHIIISFNAEWGLAVVNGGNVRCTDGGGTGNGWAEFHAWGNSTMIAPGTGGRHVPAPDTISPNGSVILLAAPQG
jgi:hypothetical protein